MSIGVFDDAEHGINQVAVNDYPDRSGIGLHVEDPAAGSVIATLSLLAPVQLVLSRAVGGGVPAPRAVRDKDNCLKVLLEPRSLLLLQGESRYSYAHAIRRSRLVPLRDGGVHKRGPGCRRVSLTFRQILEDKRSSQRKDFPDGFRVYDSTQARPVSAR
eukprot:gnl/TRDRNA2_/TRDRNA2_206963_c0_seq1.p1 gnl/TRDRNA2_/TRDRNA2_206963_c0~~gnl/TRDRNA2_/TRDRNA2_206963_c0_seq1.p1  ORF type:complete len:159 (-),score=29.60 gnl/TRDRNA2_/TRDRNA2_206963_c0_seq1:72-548(-)